MELVILQTHIAIIPDSTEQVSVLGMKMLFRTMNQIAKLMTELDNNSFLEKEILMLDQDLVFYDQVCDSSRFIIIPIVNNTASKSLWVETMLQFMSKLFSGDITVPKELCDLKARIDALNTRLESNEVIAITDYSELCDYIKNNFGQATFNSSVVENLKLSYSGVYGTMYLYMIKDEL